MRACGSYRGPRTPLGYAELGLVRDDAGERAGAQLERHEHIVRHIPRASQRKATGRHEPEAGIKGGVAEDHGEFVLQTITSIQPGLNERGADSVPLHRRQHAHRREPDTTKPGVRRRKSRAASASEPASSYDVACAITRHAASDRSSEINAILAEPFQSFCTGSSSSSSPPQ